MPYRKYTSVLRSPGLLSLVAFVLVGACTPTAEVAGGKDSGASDDLPACGLGPTMGEIEKKLFQGLKCSICHGAKSIYPTSLDTLSPGLADRVVDKMAEADPNKGKCAGRELLPKNDPLSGLFVEKVAGTPACGVRMPMNMAPLSDDDISCVKRWALLAAKAAP